MSSPQTLVPSPIIVIMGPTAAGKSALALEIARAHNGEIINADSRQVYVGMDVGTDKIGGGHPPTLDEVPSGNPGHPPTRDLVPSGNPGQRVPTHNGRSPAWEPGTGARRDKPILVDGISHYLINILTPDQRYSAAEFRDDAQRIIANIHARGKLPMVVGGTGFYIRALTGDRELPNVPPDPLFRAWADGQPLEDLAEELQETAPYLAAKVDNFNNRQRVTRYLEIARGSRQQIPTHAEQDPAREHGAAGSSQQSPTASFLLPTAQRFFKLAIIPPPDVLQKRIEERADAQLKRGFVEEVRRLVRLYGTDAPGLKAVGYREAIAFLEGTFPESELRQRIIRGHRDYARRQLTWLRKEPRLTMVKTPREAEKQITQILGR